MVVVLLALRFVLELALFASIGVVGLRVTAPALPGWALAIGLVALAVATWGVFLAPRRRVDLPLGARVGLELTLFGLAAWGLAWAGHAPWGWTLIVTEVIVVALLWSLKLPPGSDSPSRPGPGHA